MSNRWRESRVMTRIRRRQRRWKFSRLFSCPAYVVQDSLPYSKILLKDARLVHLEFGVHRQLVASPHSLAQLRHHGGGFFDAFSNFCEWKATGNCWAQVGWSGRLQRWKSVLFSGVCCPRLTAIQQNIAQGRTPDTPRLLRSPSVGFCPHSLA